MAKVNLIIPTFNRPHLLPRCVDSALRAGSDIEVIVVDDASCDETATVCKTLRDIKYIRLDRNQGVAGARNAGLLASTSDYISFLDDDDVRLPDSIDAQVAALEIQPDAGMIYGRALFGDRDCRPKGGSYPDSCLQGDIFWQLMQGNFIPCLTVVFRRACLDRVGLLDEKASGVDDWDMWVRIAESFPVLATEKEVAIWRQPTPESGQFSFRAERLYRRARRLQRNKWLRLPRSVAAGVERRREASLAFADRATQHLIWEAATSLKEKRLPDFVRVAFALALMYPLGAAKALSASTWRFLTSS